MSNVNYKVNFFATQMNNTYSFTLENLTFNQISSLHSCKDRMARLKEQYCQVIHLKNKYFHVPAM